MSNTTVRDCIAIVEPVSNGVFYIDAAKKLGLHVILVVPYFEGLAEVYEAFRRKGVETSLQKGAECMLVPKSGEFSELTGLLEPHATRLAAIVAGSEAGVESADALAAHFGLLGNSPQTSSHRRNKMDMQEALRDAGIKYIRSRAARTTAEGLDFAREIGSFPIVVKDLAGAGTAGLHFCKNLAELEVILDEAFTQSDVFGNKNDEVLVQEFVSGREYMVNTVSREGEHALTDMWVCNKVAIGSSGNAHDYAKLITRLEPVHMDLLEYTKKALTALGFAYGPAHSEVTLTQDGPVLIETGARPMGGSFPQELLQESLGHYIADRALESYLSPELFRQHLDEPYEPVKCFMVKMLISPREEDIRSLPILPFAGYFPSLLKGNLMESLNSLHVKKTTDLYTIPGFFYLIHEDEDVLMRDYTLLRKMEAEHFHMLFADESVAHGLPEAHLDRTEANALFSCAAGEGEGESWHIMEDTPSAEISAAWPNWHHVASDALPQDALLQRVLITGLKTQSELEDLLSSVEQICSQVVPGGSLTIVWERENPGLSQKDMKLIFEILGWSVIKEDPRVLRAIKGEKNTLGKKG